MTAEWRKKMTRRNEFRRKSDQQREESLHVWHWIATAMLVIVSGLIGALTTTIMHTVSQEEVIRLINSDKDKIHMAVELESIKETQRSQAQTQNEMQLTLTRVAVVTGAVPHAPKYPKPAAYNPSLDEKAPINISDLTNYMRKKK